MISIPIEWRLGIKGSNEVKSELDRLSQAFDKAKASGGEYGKEQRALSTAVNRRIQEDRLQNNLLLAQHPMILKASRAMSALTSITRTLLTIQNTLNIAKIASSNVDIEGLGIQSELNEALRRRTELQRQGKIGTEEWIKNEENINILLAKQKEHIEEVKNTKFNDWITVISTTLFGVASGFSIVKNHLREIIGVIGRFGVLSAGLLNPLTAIGVAMAAVGGFIADWLVGLLGLNEWRDKNGKMLEEFFTISIPTALGNAALFMTNFFLNDLPNWVTIATETVMKLFASMWGSIKEFSSSAINFIVDQITSFINRARSLLKSLIDFIVQGARSLGGRLTSGGSNTNQYSGMQGSAVTSALHAANGFNGMVNQPTLFLAGEGGPEQVNITPKGETSGGGNTVIINVAGSVVTEKKLAYMVDQYQKQNLKSRGFTGFG